MNRPIRRYAPGRRPPSQLLRAALFGAIALPAAGCAIAPQGVARAGAAAHASLASTGNITWNRTHLTLPYPPSPREAVLTYWAPNGYFTTRSCDNGGRFAARLGRRWGNPSGYEHVAYHFEAKRAGPAACGFDAVLNNTGSPPIAVLDLRIRR